MQAAWEMGLLRAVASNKERARVSHWSLPNLDTPKAEARVSGYKTLFQAEYAASLLSSRRVG